MYFCKGQNLTHFDLQEFATMSKNHQCKNQETSGMKEKEKEGGEKSEEKEVKDKLAQRIMTMMEKDNIDEKEKEKSHLKKFHRHRNNSKEGKKR